jgi:hypothetical protein
VQVKKRFPCWPAGREEYTTSAAKADCTEVLVWPG